MTVNQRQHHLSDLREYTEYTFWVSAFNANGEGAFSAEVVARTHSDVPADPPLNVTVEAASSRSLIVRWEPPPKESQNGIITGYKLRSVGGRDECRRIEFFPSSNRFRWRKHKRGRSQVVTTDGSRRLYAIAGLDRGTAYQVGFSIHERPVVGFTKLLTQKTGDFENSFNYSIRLRLPR